MSVCNKTELPSWPLQAGDVVAVALAGQYLAVKANEAARESAVSIAGV